MKKSKVLTTFLCGVMMLSLAACSNKDSDSSSSSDSTPSTSGSESEVKSDLSEPGVLPIWQGEGTPEIGVLLTQNDWVSDYTDNAYTKWIEESCNMKLVFEMLPNVDTATVLNTRVASNVEMPDVLCYGLSLETAKSYADAGALLSLTEYYNKGICVNTDAADAAFPNYNIKGNITNAEGNIYAIPKIQASPSNEVKYKMWINQHWLDNLGIKLEDIKTTEDFRNVLTRFKNDDPNGNGQADELAFNTPASSWGGTPYKFLTNAFVFEGDGDMLMLDNGKVTTSYLQDAWFEAQEYIKGLVDDGLLTKESFTQDQNAVVTYMTSNPDTVGCLTNSSLGAWGDGDLLKKDEDGNYMKDDAGNYVIDTDNLREPYSTLAPLTGPNGVNYASYAASSTQGLWYVTKWAENPELCIRVGDFQFTEEGFLRGRFGIENENWMTKENYLAENPGVELTARYAAMGYEGEYVMYNDIFGQNQNLNWYDAMPYFSGNVEAEGMFVSKDADGKITSLENNATMRQETASGVYQNLIPGDDVYCPALHFTDDETEIISTIQTDLKNFVAQERVAYYLGQDGVLTSGGKDAFLNELKAIGIDQFLDICQTAYDRQYK